jgi:hypothetical protein
MTVRLLMDAERPPGRASTRRLTRMRTTTNARGSRHWRRPSAHQHAETMTAFNAPIPCCKTAVWCRRAVLLVTWRPCYSSLHSTRAGDSWTRARAARACCSCARVEQACTQMTLGISQAAACNVIGVVQRGVKMLRGRVASRRRASLSSILQRARAAAGARMHTRRASLYAEGSWRLGGSLQRDRRRATQRQGVFRVGAVARALCARETFPARVVRTPCSVRDGMCLGDPTSCTACQACLD